MDVYRMNKAITSESGVDNGKLRALLTMRGDAPADYTTDWDQIAINTKLSAGDAGNAYLIPKIQKEFDIFINALTDTINKAFSSPIDGKIPVGQGIGKDEYGTKLFVTKDGGPNLSVGNITINPKLLENGGYNYLPTSLTGDESDTQVIENLLAKWNEGRGWLDGGETTSPHKKNTTFRSFYSEFIAELGAEGSEATGRAEEKRVLILDIDNNRQSMGGVSTDEEMTNMMKYQYSYNAAARMITVLDGMLDTLINRTGR